MSSRLSGDIGKQEQDSIRALMVLSGLYALATVIPYLLSIRWSWPFPRDSSTLVVGRDLLNFWMYGQAAVTPDPGRFYDPGLYDQVLNALLGTDYPAQNWSYPPSVMLVAAPFGQLSYTQALLCWTVLSVALFVWVGSRCVSDRRPLILLLLSPAAVLCLMSGQSSFVTAAMLLTIFAWLDRKPAGAGILIGLMTLKPQLGVLFPILLIASGRWRVFLWAAATTLGIIGLTAALFGPQVWIDFVQKGIPTDNLVLLDVGGALRTYQPTIFTNLRGLDASYRLAMTAQGVLALGAIGAVAWAFRYRKHADPLLLAALFLACSICASPYLFSYDLVAATFVIVILLANGELDARGRALAKLMYWLPFIQLVLGRFAIPGPALIPPVFALYALLRLKDLADWGRPAPWRQSESGSRRVSAGGPIGQNAAAVAKT